MSDKFSSIPLRDLLKFTLHQIDRKHSFFGIPEELFFKPATDTIRIGRFGSFIESPVGVAAGPHSQMAQNIIAAWICGARYIELKTIQTLDDLNVTKPCIDMQDEGYNCEWSQELKIRDSFEQYLNAWIIIHILKDKLGHKNPSEIGTIFNMSVGYDLRGIQEENVQWFLEKMKDCSFEKSSEIEEIKDIYPRIKELRIPDRISDNVTLSTMHGCPPDEIEKIGLYLLEEKKLHTLIKLNPTLLGKEKLTEIIAASGFETIVPDSAFEHDLKYPDALRIIDSLKKSAEKSGLFFGLKLTNTLESLNNKNIFPSTEKTMYMSGRALHPVAVSLAAKLQNDFNGSLNISFSAGVNAFNAVKVLECGLKPVTVCTDILKPGGYGLLNQYIQNIESAVIEGSLTLNNGTVDSSYAQILLRAKNLNILNHYAIETLNNPDFKKTDFRTKDIKSERELGFFDCIKAPCTEACPTNQDIPDYLYYTAEQDYANAFKTIMRRNPFPNTTGVICDHLCQTKCTRMNYDSPLQIREIKRFIAENYTGNNTKGLPKTQPGKVAIIGAGPSGLSCAYFLALAGFTVGIFETKDKPGGMISKAIPSFRMTEYSLEKDIERIEQLGIVIHYNHRIGNEEFERLRQNFRFVYIAAGAQLSKIPYLPGINACGVLDPLVFLADVKKGRRPVIGKQIAIIGGGNTAMDVARTAWRIAGTNGKVTVLYRRSVTDMPADSGEIKAVIDEGIKIMEYIIPQKINTRNDSVISITCVKSKPGDKDETGRRKPVEIPGSEFEFECDTIIPAIGQDLDLDFISGELLEVQKGFYETGLKNVFIGGDALRGASTAINAIGDGRKAAQQIAQRAGYELQYDLPGKRQVMDFKSHMLKRMKKVPAVKIKETEVYQRRNFDLVSFPFTEAEAVFEASRCLSCDEICNICITVCPNLANYSYQAMPVALKLSKVIRSNGKSIIVEDSDFIIIQQYQILHIDDWCNRCGNCSTFCPTKGAPYLDKPHLFLSKDRFDKEVNGFFYDASRSTLIGKQEDQIHTLKLNQNEIEYETKGSQIILSSETFNILKYNLHEQAMEIGLQTAALMKIILEGVHDFYGYSNEKNSL